MNNQTIRGYICRDKIGNLMFFTGKPVWDEFYECWLIGQDGDICCDVPQGLLPEITWEDEPREAEMEIRQV